VTVSLSENDRSSSCSFSVCDPGLLIGAKYRQMSIDAGGILVPSDLLGDAATATATTGTGTATPGSSGPLSANAEDSVKLIVAECQRQGVTNPQQIAYILATAQHESDQFKTLEEYADGSAYEGRSDLGNTQPGDGVKFKGRGFVQLTGRVNYDKYSKIVGKDLINNPELLQQDAGLSAFVLVHGMMNGAYTGASLSDYTDASGNVDFNGARAIVNGNDRASLIAGYAQDWLKKVPQYLGSTPTPMQTATPSTPGSPAPVQTPPVVETSSKGTEIIIEIAVGWGLTFRDALSFHFIHTSTETSWDASGTQITTFGGQSVRWLLTRVPVTESFQNITFKQYLEQRCKAFGLDLQMEGDGLRYEHLSQDGQTHLQTILREAQRIGFAIKEGTGKESGKLIVQPEARPEFSNFIIDEQVLVKPARFTDKARAASSGAPAATVSSPQTGSGETKPALDRTTGDVAQTAPESQAGTGNAPGSTGATTGATASPVGGTVKPDSGSATPTATPTATPAPTPAPAGQAITESKTEGPVKTTKPDGTEVITTKTTTTKTESGKITKTIETRTITTQSGQAPQAQTKTQVVEITPAGKKTTTTISKPGQPDETTTKQEPITAEEKRQLEVSQRSPSEQAAAAATPQPGAGLPNQQPGAIDLADGKAQAQSISDEAKRIKGYEDSCVVVMSMDTLAIVPGQIVALSKRLFPDAFATEKRIGSVEHDFAAGQTTLNFYVPQALPSGTQLASPVNMPTNPGGFVFPIPSGATTIGDGLGTRPGRSAGYLHTILDVTAPEGTITVAMADGVIDYVGNEGAAGNMMVIKYAGGYESIYMHGMPGGFIVESGPVKQGQPVFKIGTTGQSSGSHLHLKFTLNGTYCLLSKVGIDVLKIGLPIERYNETCNQY
jgi:murein DD-endopeptidase MepM/ murein hydrolase activator NlpD